MADAVVLCMLLATALFVLAGALYFFEKEGLFSTFLVFSVGVFIYFLLIPIELWLRGQEGYMRGDYYVELGADILHLIVQSFLALPGFLLGLVLGGYPRLREPRIPMGETPVVSKRHVLMLFFWLAVFLVAYGPNLRQEMASYFNVAGQNHASPAYGLLKYTLLLITCFVGARLVVERKLLGWPIIALPFLLGMVTHDKNPALMSLIAAAVAWSPRIRSAPVALLGLLAAVPVLFILLVLVRSFSYLRADYSFLQATAMALEELSFTRIDPAGPYVAIEHYVSGASRYSGLSYLDNFSLMIPRFLYPDRPADLAEAFAREQISNWQEGQGLGFSPLAEAFLNFKYFAILHFVIIGILWAVVWRIVRTAWGVVFPADLFVTFYKVFGFYLLLLSFRSTSLHFFNIVPLYALAGMLALACIGLGRIRK